MLTKKLPVTIIGQMLLSLLIICAVIMPFSPLSSLTVNNAYADNAVENLTLDTAVVDEAQLLTSSEKQQLEQQLRSIYSRGLAQAGLVIVPTTDGQDIVSYGMQVADKWQLGNKETDDGLLILVAVNDRKMHIFTGYGLEGVLPDGAVGRIIRDDITPAFKQGNYAQGLSQGIATIEQRLTTDPQILAQADELAEQRDKDNKNNQGSSDASEQVMVIAFIMAVFGKFAHSLLGRVLGSSLLTGLFIIVALLMGVSLIFTLSIAFFLWIILMSGFTNSVRTVGGFSSGGGGFGGGSSGGGGFGGFSGGGGGFGGGGAGGSW